MTSSTTTIDHRGTIRESRHPGYRAPTPALGMDVLTGALNHQGMTALLQTRIVEAAHGDATFGLCLFDIDRFRRVNARHGRARGDEVLCQLVQVITGVTRQRDQLARWADDEFLLLAPDTDLRMSLRLAERIRARVSSRAFTGIDQISLSAGVACYKAGDTPATLLARLERRRAAARNGGRNQVCASG